MPPTKSGSNLRALNQRQRDLARAEYLRHPDASISEVAKATGVGIRTVARAREALVREGLLPAGRNSEDGAALAEITHSVRRAPIKPERPKTDQPASEGVSGLEDPTPEAASEASGHSGLKDGEAIRQMSQMLDEIADENDEATLKRMLRLFKRFSADPDLHPDTRMTASQGWMKLKEQARQKDLGPGVPMTLALAISRATDFLKACGIKVAVPAFFAAFPELAPPAEAPPPEA